MNTLKINLYFYRINIHLNINSTITMRVRKSYSSPLLSDERKIVNFWIIWVKYELSKNTRVKLEWPAKVRSDEEDIKNISEEFSSTFKSKWQNIGEIEKY